MYTYNNTCDDQLRRKLQEAEREREEAEYQLQREREAATQRAEDAHRERVEANRQRWSRAARQATTWPEALQKQANLFAPEAHQDDEGDDVGAYFMRGKEACERALKLWEEEEPKLADQIAALEKQIALLRDAVRLTVADRLDAEMPNNEGIANTIRTTPEDESELSDWLNW